MAGLEAAGDVRLERNGAKVVDLDSSGLGCAVLTKADGASTYLSRDIAAAHHRRETQAFDRMLYVAGGTQELHFRQLFRLLELSKTGSSVGCQHVPFGQVRGMSTRRGTVVFLAEILDEAGARMLEVLKRSQTKYAEIADPAAVAEAVGLSAVVVQDLKSKRTKGYAFEWDRILTPEGDTGPYLQYTHARLASIGRLSGAPVDPRCSVASLVEPEAARLVLQLSRWPEVINHSLNTHEPSVVVQYMLELARHGSRAIGSLRVKGAQEPEAVARMLLFHRTRQTLAQGLRLIGLTPLDRI